MSRMEGLGKPPPEMSPLIRHSLEEIKAARLREAEQEKSR